MYDNDTLISIYKEKRHFNEGVVDEIAVENNCGDSISMFIYDGKMNWNGYGCFITTCAAEIVCLMYNKGQNVSMNTISDEFIGNLPSRRKQCVQIVIDAYNKAIGN